MAEHLELVAEIPKVEKLSVQERLEYAKKRRAQQLRRWDRDKDSDFGPPPRKKKFRNKPLSFEPQFMLLDAATRGDVDEVKRMLENGTDPNICNDDGLTALHQASIDGCEEIIDILLDHGAVLDGVDRELWTPLHAATACGNEDIVEYLLDQGANIVAINADGNMPIDLIEDDDELRDILEAEMEEQGYTEEKLEELRDQEEQSMLTEIKNQMRADDDFDMDRENNQGVTLVHISAANCYEEALEFLIEHGAATDCTDKDGWQPIHGAAVWGNERVLGMLVESGADLDAKTLTGETPLTLCEDPDLQQVLVDLKNKVKANKSKSARRKRSNSRSLSVKRTSLKDKITISQNEAKAEAILRVHPQLAFLLPKEQDKNNKLKPMDVTPAASAGEPMLNSTINSTINTKKQDENSKTSSLSRGKGKENVNPNAEGVPRDNTPKDIHNDTTRETKPSFKITVKTHTTIIDNKPQHEQQPPRSPKNNTNQQNKPDVTIETPPKDNRYQQNKPDVTIETPPKDNIYQLNKPDVTIATPPTPTPDNKVPLDQPKPDGQQSTRSPTNKPNQDTKPDVTIATQGIRDNMIFHTKASTLPRKTYSSKPPTGSTGGNLATRSASDAHLVDRPKTSASSMALEPKTNPPLIPSPNKDLNSNLGPQPYDSRLHDPNKAHGSSADNGRLRTGSDAAARLAKSPKSKPAPPPPLPRSSGSLSRSHEPADTSGYPDSFSKKSRNSRENILEVVASGRLASPENKGVSSADVKIEPTAGKAKYTAKNKPQNQPNQSNKQVYTETYRRRDSSENLNNQVVVNDNVQVEREKKKCCVLM